MLGYSPFHIRPSNGQRRQQFDDGDSGSHLAGYTLDGVFLQTSVVSVGHLLSHGFFRRAGHDDQFLTEIGETEEGFPAKPQRETSRFDGRRRRGTVVVNVLERPDLARRMRMAQEGPRGGRHTTSVVRDFHNVQPLIEEADWRQTEKKNKKTE